MESLINKVSSACLAKVFSYIDFEDVRDFIKNERKLSKEQLSFTPQGVIVMLFPYYSPELLKGEKNISAYAALPDYHMVIGKLLERGIFLLSENQIQGKGFVDDSPFFEKKLAERVGLGTIGKNNLLINKKYGTYFFIGEIVCDRRLLTTPFPLKERNDANCKKCGKCIANCPTGALNKDGYQKEKCLSYILQKKQDFSDAEKELLKDSSSIWGCDICQNICPANSKVERTEISEFQGKTKKIFEDEDFKSREEFQRNFKNYAYFYKGYDLLKRNYDFFRKKDK